MSDLKIFAFNMVVVVLGVVLLFLTSLLFELKFVNEHISRQLVVYFVMVFEFFIMARIIYLYNKI